MADIQLTAPLASNPNQANQSIRAVQSVGVPLRRKDVFRQLGMTAVPIKFRPAVPDVPDPKKTDSRKHWVVGSVPSKKVAALTPPAMSSELEAFARRLVSPATPAVPPTRATAYRPAWSEGFAPGGRSFFEQFTKDAIAATPAGSAIEEPVMLDPADLATIPNENRTSRIVSSGDPATLAALTFRDAGDRWIESHAVTLRGKSEAGYRHNLKTICKFLGKLRMREIHIGHLSAYQQARMANEVVFTDGHPIKPWRKPARASIINHEMSVVQMVMKRAGCWAPLAPLYQPLQEAKSTKRKVLDDVEERRFFAIAASRPEWELATLAVTITRHTTASGCELRNLKLGDVILDQGKPRIIVNADTAKNNFRGRTICLNELARKAVERCVEMATAKGSTKHDHYLFPYRIRAGAWIPTRACTNSWINRPWRELREAAGLPWLTPHCFRHMCITGLLAKGVAPETVRHIAGHVTEEMMRHYSHDRHEDQQRALDKLVETDQGKPKPKAATQPGRSQSVRPSMTRRPRYLPMRSVRRP